MALRHQRQRLNMESPLETSANGSPAMATIVKVANRHHHQQQCSLRLAAAISRHQQRMEAIEKAESCLIMTKSAAIK
jgi:hypothetical protein